MVGGFISIHISWWSSYFDGSSFMASNLCFSGRISGYLFKRVSRTAAFLVGCSFIALQVSISVCAYVYVCMYVCMSVYDFYV